MSRSPSDSQKKKTLFKLKEASQYPQWKQRLQTYFFKKFKNVNMDKIKVDTTLDTEYFKKEFKTEHKAASKDATGAAQEPMQDPAFLTKCSEHAFDTGEGFHPWLYDTFADIRDNLSADINKQTSGVRLGDLVGLLEAIKLSIQHFEVFDPTDLEMKFSASTMAQEGQNDLLKFIAVLKQYMNRLSTAGHPIPDAKAQRVLLRGVHKDIFEPLIRDATRRPYATFAELVKAFHKEAADERVMEKLRALKPGVTKGMYVTVDTPARPPAHDSDSRLNRIEAAIEHVYTTITNPGECRYFAKTGDCRYGSKCTFKHTASGSGQGRDGATTRSRLRQREGYSAGEPDSKRRRQERPAGGSSESSNATAKFCAFHLVTLGQDFKHNTDECTHLKRQPEHIRTKYQRVHREMALMRAEAKAQVTSTSVQEAPSVDIDFAFCTTVKLPDSILAMTDGQKLDRWGVDGCSTIHATWNRDNCFNIRRHKTTICGADRTKTFTSEEIGDCIVAVVSQTGVKTTLQLRDVVISPNFPFHIVSEIKCFEAKCTAVKKKGSWQFFKPDATPLFHASQQLLKAPVPSAIYFMDTPASTNAQRTMAVQRAHDAPAPQPLQPASALPVAKKQRTAPPIPAKLSTAKNNQLLIQLHLAKAHRGFRELAKQHGLTLPDPPPDCWACLFANPRGISHDTITTRVVSRVFEGVAADAKGPMQTPTPEGYQYFFVILCLYSFVNWVKLVKSQSEWPEIWKAFVAYAEAHTGRPKCIAYIITDGHKVHTQASMRDFNAANGTQTVTAAPYSQWQDPAERYVGTITNAGRANLIHGGGEEHMWGDAVVHAGKAANTLLPPRPVAGHEGKSRQRILDPSITEEKELRSLHPFLCLALAKIPSQLVGSNFKPRATVCLHLYYDRSKKAYALLTIPDRKRIHRVDVRHYPMTFPLRVTNHLSRQMYRSFDTSAQECDFEIIHGPGNVLQRSRIGGDAPARDAVLHDTPVEVRNASGGRQGPGWSSTRGYRPSVAGLESIASSNATTTLGPGTPSPSLPPMAQWVCVANASGRPKLTSDQLAARVPKSTKQALTCPDKEYWLPAIKKDFAMIRDKGCVVDVTTAKPGGPNPPALEQRFKNKYREEEPIALSDLPPGDWKARTILRGDRCKPGLHYNQTAAPVVHTPALKMLVAWAVQKGLSLFSFDETAAFYGNDMDVQGFAVKLCDGYDPHSTDIRPLHLPPLYGKVAKALPGMPQGSLLHYKGFAGSLSKVGFEATKVDPCLFVHTDGTMAVGLHVDDGILAAPTADDAERILGKGGLGMKRQLTWGPLKSFLGIEFQIDYTPTTRTVFMSQPAYAKTILERGNALNANAVPTPAVPGRKYTTADCPSSPDEAQALARRGMLQKDYITLVMSLNYLVSTTRDDMRFIQGKVAKYMANPGKEHFLALRHMLKFLSGTSNYGIEFKWSASDPPPEDGPLTIEAWSDSSYADDVDTGRTTLGFVVKVNNATVSSYSKLSKRVDSCINHSELRAFAAAAGQPDTTDGASMAFNETSRTVAYVRGVKAALEQRDDRSMPPSKINVDNTGVLSVLEDVTMKPANKHIFRTVAENRERVHLDRAVRPSKVHTKKNLANAMTKQEPGLAESAAQLRSIVGPSSAKQAVSVRGVVLD